MSWLETSVRIVEQTLAALPPDATEAQVKSALRAAYPFGRRKMHPYKQWCKAQKWALDYKFRRISKRELQLPPPEETPLFGGTP